MLVSRRGFIVGLVAAIGCGLGCSSEPTGMKGMEPGTGAPKEIPQPGGGPGGKRKNGKFEPDADPDPKAPPLNR
jgi:hypothetical protein